MTNFAGTATDLRRRSDSGENVAAERAIAQSRFAQAEQDAIDAIEFTPYDQDNYMHQVNLYNSAAYIFNDPSFYSRALDAAIRASELAPRRPVILTAMAVSYLNLGDTARALPLLAGARTIDPLYPEAWVLSASILLEEGDWGGALRLVETARAHLPGNPKIEALFRDLTSEESSTGP